MSAIGALKELERAVAKGGWLVIEEVNGRPRLSTIAALPPRDSHQATASLFEALLADAFGDRIGAFIGRELKLDHRDGWPLAAAEVRQGLKIARSSLAIYAGMNFMVKLKAVRAIPPLPADRHRLVNRLFTQSFAAAAQGHRVLVDAAAAQAMVETAVATVRGMSDGQLAAASRVTLTALCDPGVES